MPTESKDLIMVIMGASVSLGGLLLVFGGFVFSQAESFPDETTDDSTIKRFKKAGKYSLWPFLLSLMVAGLSFVWLLYPTYYLYLSSLIGFAILLIGTGIYGITVLKYYL